jgi:ABC-type dipeptide/oligopeptide/nickel transport system permease component
MSKSAEQHYPATGEDRFMWAYILRRILLTIPTVLGIVLLTFLLFSLLSKDPARAYAGKQASPQTLEAIRAKM